MSRYLLYTLVLALVAAVWVLLTPTTVSYERTPETVVAEAIEYIEIEHTPELLPELVPICSCESAQGKYGTPTHYEADGVTVLRGRVNPDDIGMCQINLGYHQEAAAALGLDLFVEADNITFANLLYEQSGNQPWVWSKSCWR